MANYPASKPSASPTDHTALLDEVRLLADGAGYTPVAKTTTYTMAAGEFVKADTTTPWTLTLPAATVGVRCGMMKVSSDANALTVVPASGTINDAASLTITEQYAGCYLIPDGTNWFVVGVF